MAKVLMERILEPELPAEVNGGPPWLKGVTEDPAGAILQLYDEDSVARHDEVIDFRSPPRGRNDDPAKVVIFGPVQVDWSVTKEPPECSE